MSTPPDAFDDRWPDLALPTLKATCETLQLWTQVVGKVRLVQTPWLNHSWHVPLYVSAVGLSTSLIPHADGAFEMEFDIVESVLRIRTVRGGRASVALEAQTLARFHDRVMQALAAVGVPVAINDVPCEMPDPVTPFAEDHTPRPYDPAAARAFWRALLRVDEVFKQFRTGFLGKASPVHLFWGGLDLAVTRFSGRTAPPHPGGVPHLPDAVAREAYSHEVASAGFWPLGAGGPAFYAYAYPEPAGYRDATVGPAGAAYDKGLGEYLLAYEAVRAAPDPAAALMVFLNTTYDAAADLGHWDREALECDIGRPGRPREV